MKRNSLQDLLVIPEQAGPLWAAYISVTNELREWLNRCNHLAEDLDLRVGDRLPVVVSDRRYMILFPDANLRDDRYGRFDGARFCACPIKLLDRGVECVNSRVTLFEELLPYFTEYKARYEQPAYKVDDTVYDATGRAYTVIDREPEYAVLQDDGAWCQGFGLDFLNYWRLFSAKRG